MTTGPLWPEPQPSTSNNTYSVDPEDNSIHILYLQDHGYQQHKPQYYLPHPSGPRESVLCCRFLGSWLLVSQDLVPLTLIPLNFMKFILSWLEAHIYWFHKPYSHPYLLCGTWDSHIHFWKSHKKAASLTTTWHLLKVPSVSQESEITATGVTSPGINCCCSTWYWNDPICTLQFFF